MQAGLYHQIIVCALEEELMLKRLGVAGLLPLTYW